ncbi:HNH endonuclease signature motif containing protein [Agreia bicolorata]|uniref:HNH endonuclease signature motif containing protein n=1 Tax=Agreia bicolorata TaxID=110935 RepID=UPI000697B059|nr:HNH endonuclease signature motif containing protein [Agreia bicolorata]
MTSPDISLEQSPYVLALERIAARDRQIAELSALRATEVHDAWQLLLAEAPHDQSTAGPRWSPARVAEVEFFTEIAMLTRRTEYRARTLADTAIALVSKLPASFAVFVAGGMSEEHAAVIATHSEGLEGEALEKYDARMARLAPGLTYKQLEYRARSHAQTVQPETVVEQVEKAAKTRRVTVDPGKDGMAYLTLFAPAPEVYAIANRAVSLAKGLKVGGDLRSITQLRVDVLSDLLLNGETSIPGATKGIRGRVHVMVPAMTLLGVGEEPAILRGYGPIDPVTAARLTADATSWRRILTDPITGRILQLSPADYRPTQEMRDHATLVHPYCVFGGCADDSVGADIDHTRDFAAHGLTEDDNLAPLAPTHHRVKHHTRWQIDQGENNTLIWTSPAGLVYAFEPQGMMRPAPKALVDAVTKGIHTEVKPEEPCPF